MVLARNGMNKIIVNSKIEISLQFGLAMLKLTLIKIIKCGSSIKMLIWQLKIRKYLLIAFIVIMCLCAIGSELHLLSSAHDHDIVIDFHRLVDWQIIRCLFVMSIILLFAYLLLKAIFVLNTIYLFILAKIAVRRLLPLFSHDIKQANVRLNN